MAAILFTCALFTTALIGAVVGNAVIERLTKINHQRADESADTVAGCCRPGVCPRFCCANRGK